MKHLIEKLIGYKLQKRIPGFHYCPNLYGAPWDKLNDIREDKEFFELATKVIKDRTTSLYYDRLYTFWQLIPQIIFGNFLEAGVYKGGSAYFIAEAAKRKFKYSQVFAVDTFEGFKAADKPDGHNSVGVFGDVSYEAVKLYLSLPKNIEVIKSRIQDWKYPLENFGLIHLDMDIYEPTAWALDNLWPRVVEGGFIVLDDYNTKSCPGVTRAVDNFHEGLKINLVNGQCVITK